MPAICLLLHLWRPAFQPAALNAGRIVQVECAVRHAILSRMQPSSATAPSAQKNGHATPRNPRCPQVEVAGAPAKAILKVLGQGIVPSVTLDPPNLNFGDVKNNDYAHQAVSIANQGLLPVRFKAAKAVPYFWCEPDTGLVDKGSSVEVKIRCVPGAMFMRARASLCTCGCGKYTRDLRSYCVYLLCELSSVTANRTGQLLITIAC